MIRVRVISSGEIYQFRGDFLDNILSFLDKVMSGYLIQFCCWKIQLEYFLKSKHPADFINFLLS